MTKKGNLFVIAGPSGVGKGTLVKQLLANHSDIKLSVSATTRAPRPGEKSGFHYFFIDKDVFKEHINQNKFLEWAEFANNYYGTYSQHVEDVLSQGNDVLLEIEMQGAIQIRKIGADAKFVFIFPPSFEELKSRLINRETETPEAIEKRLAQAKWELEEGEKFDFKVVNDDLAKAYKELEEIILSQRN